MPAEEEKEVKEEKEVGVQEKGKPVEEPASKETEPAEKEVGAEMLDVAKTYRSRRNPEGVSGAELWSGYGRGKLYDGLQSEHQKLQTETTDKDTRIAALEAQVQSSVVKEQAAQAIQELGLPTGQKPVADQDDAWLNTDQPAPATNLDPRATASRLEEVAKKTTEDFLVNLLPELKEAVIGVGKQEQQEQELQAQQRQTTSQLKANEIAGLKVEFPDANDADIEDLASRTLQYTGHLVSAVDNYNARNVADGNEALFDGQDVMKALVQKRTELALKQTEITAQRERDAELEGLNSGTLPGEEPEEERKMAFKKGDVEKNRESGLAKAKAYITRRAALKNSGM